MTLSLLTFYISETKKLQMSLWQIIDRGQSAAEIKTDLAVNNERVVGTLTVASEVIQGNQVINGNLLVQGTTTLNQDLLAQGPSQLNGTTTIVNANIDFLHVIQTVESNLTPNTDLSYGLGDSNHRWTQMYSSQIHGDQVYTSTLLNKNGGPLSIVSDDPINQFIYIGDPNHDNTRGMNFYADGPLPTDLHEIDVRSFLNADSGLAVRFNPSALSNNLFITPGISTTCQSDWNIGSGAKLQIDKQPLVTQITSISTAVTTNGAAGTIATVSSTLAASGFASFLVNNNKMSATSQVMTQVIGYSGTTGNPCIFVSTVNPTNFVITIRNADPVFALNGIITFSYMLF